MTGRGDPLDAIERELEDAEEDLRRAYRALSSAERAPYDGRLCDAGRHRENVRRLRERVRVYQRDVANLEERLARAYEDAA